MKYRTEIDGLRAVAVIPVILFHAGSEMFSGGFVGVDVFFVISGYLITTIILTEKQQGIFSLVNFYERRARRILPALFLVMLVSLPFAWFWLLPTELKDFSQSLISVATFSSNIFFWQTTGYWEVANELKPLLHTWSLAVEEQYYLFFPLFLMLMWRFRKRWILGSFLVIAVSSLVLAQWGTLNHPIATFYLLPTRVWELAIGASIAFYMLFRKQTVRALLSNRFIDEFLGFAGLLMIGYAVFEFDETVPFPGLYALLPTVGSGLIILFASSHTLVGRLLSIKVFVGIGLISYSAYLWHQPLFSLARNRSLTEPSDLLYGGLALLSILLAYVSWRYVERPFRRKGVINRKKIFAYSAFGTVFFVIVGLMGHASDGFQNRIRVNQTVLDDFVMHEIRANCEDRKGKDKEICKLGSLIDDKQIKFAVFGDSHSEAMLPVFDSLARSLNAQYVHSSSGCPALLGLEVVGVGGCEKNLPLRQFEYVKNNGIGKVFLVSRWTLYIEGENDAEMKNIFLVDKTSQSLTKAASRSVFERAVEKTIDAYQSIGVTVYVVFQVPQQKVQPALLYSRFSILGLTDDDLDNAIANQSALRTSSDELQAFNRKIFEKSASAGKVNILNLDDYFCGKDHCLIGDRYHSYYLDDDHVSSFGANLTADEIRPHIQ